MNKKHIIKYILFLVSILSTVVTIVLLVLSTINSKPLTESLFKIAISLSITLNLSLSISFNFTSINNSFNTVYYHSTIDNLRKSLETCYAIHANINSMLELFNQIGIGQNVESAMNDYLQHVLNYCEEINKSISIYTNDSSITLNDQKRLMFVKEYVSVAERLRDFIPFRWINIKQVNERNNEMKNILGLIKDKYLLFEEN